MVSLVPNEMLNCTCCYAFNVASSKGMVMNNTINSLPAAFLRLRLEKLLNKQLLSNLRSIIQRHDFRITLITSDYR